VDAYNYSLDKVTIFRPDLRLCYTIFPQLKTYVVARAPTNSTASNDVVRGQERVFFGQMRTENQESELIVNS